METPNYTNLQAAEKLREISIKGTASDADTLIPLQKTDSAEHKIPSKEQLKRVNFPALPYAPGPFMLSEVKNVQRTVANEMIDFLDSVRDLLKMLLLVKSKHLKSTIPIPCDVLREIHYIGDKRGDIRMRNFEKKVFGKSDIVPDLAAGQSTSSVTDSCSTGAAAPPARKPSVHDDSSDTAAGKSNQSLQSSKDLNRAKSVPGWLFGKKNKPIWQKVHEDEEEQRILREKMIEQHRKKLKEKMLPGKDAFRDLIKKPFDIGDPKCQKISKALQPRLKAEETSCEKHMEMLKAYVGGFKSIAEYHEYLDFTKAHWFKILLKESLDLGVVVTIDVVLAFERLGHYYEVKFEEIEQSRAKLCLIMQSLPIWDISRATVQRGIDFVHRNILHSAFVDKDISHWLNARKITRLIYPPVLPESTSDVQLSIIELPEDNKSRRRNALAFEEVTHAQLRPAGLYKQSSKQKH